MDAPIVIPEVENLIGANHPLLHRERAYGRVVDRKTHTKEQSPVNSKEIRSRVWEQGFG